jgi:hypothetical protein
MRKLLALLSISYGYLSLTKTVLAAPPVNLGGVYIFGGVQSVGQFLTSLGEAAFGIAGLMLTIYLLLGGFRLMMAAGDKNAVAGGREMIVHSIVGFLLLMLIFLVFEFILQFFCIGFSIIGSVNIPLLTAHCGP